MNSEELKGKFLNGQNETFILVDYELPIDIYVGYFNKLPTLVIEGLNKIERPLSTKKIQIEQYEKERTKFFQLCFSLLSNEDFDVFINFCIDIIENAKDCNVSNAITKSYKRWVVWQNLFSKKSNPILSVEQIQGLIGELLFIISSENNNQIIKKIKAWGGGDYYKKDFEFSETWNEVKTILSDKRTVQISSKEQLRSVQIGYLTVFILERTMSDGNKTITLNSIVNRITNIIEDSSVLELFLQKLYDFGYKYNEYYDDNKYLLIEKKEFVVDNKFPKIIAENLMEGIGKVTYEIDLAMITRFRKDIS